ncbi:MAG: ribosome maturation factor RimP [Candidatus Rokubacteria bacterium]|nr:ribosome maturation factor RimP [Candidatus Rokubacteria bacterium]
MSVGRETPPRTEAIEALATPVIQAHGLTLVDLELAGGRRTALRFFIDKPGGVSIDDCQRFSQEISDLLDVADLLPESFDLEVSSPGLDRELKKDRELGWAVGKQVRVWAREPVDGRREFVGRLLEVGEAFLTLAEAPASGYPGRRQVPRALLAKVRLEVEQKRSA